MSYLNDYTENTIFNCEILLVVENQDKQQIKIYNVT